MRSCFRRPRDIRPRARRGRWFPPGLRLRAGFTLLEVFATLIVLMLTFVSLAQFMGSVDQSWQAGASDPFAEAAAAFTTVTQHLEIATLEPYRDYADADGAFHTDPGAAFTPDHLALRSDLAFVCGPAASLLGLSGRTTTGSSVFFAGPAGQTQLYAQTGLDHLFNSLGYFVEFGPDADGPAFFSGATRERWRLKQVVQPSESLQIFATTTSAPWIAQLAGPSATPGILAENVVALVVLPERAASDSGPALAPAYAYDSRDTSNALTFAQLPPRVRVMLAAIDETSAQRLAAANGTTAPVLLPPGAFQDSTKFDTDVAALDASLTAAKIGHRIFQRELEVTTSAWSDTP
jgi:uncharacterized protein (TIGR02599 family)